MLTLKSQIKCNTLLNIFCFFENLNKQEHKQFNTQLTFQKNS